MEKFNTNDFELGDKVNHVSNASIIMAVIEIHSDRNEIICRWIDSKGNTQIQSFIPQELVKEKGFSTGIYLG